MKNKTTIVDEVKEGFMILQHAKSSNVILLYCSCFYIFFLNKPHVDNINLIKKDLKLLIILAGPFPYFKIVNPHIPTLKEWDQTENVFHLSFSL